MGGAVGRREGKERKGKERKAKQKSQVINKFNNVEGKGESGFHSVESKAKIFLKRKKQCS